MRASRQVLGLVGWLLLSLAAGAIGGIASVNASGFYEQLSRPAWAPPASVFGPVWTVLYLMMGVAAWLVWRAQGSAARGALALFVVQLGFNALWTWLFFAWRAGALAFIGIVTLWVLIVATLIAFRRVVRLAGALLVPYLAWVTYAAALTFAVWRLNPDVLG